MSDLSPKARALISTGRHAFRPRDADRARIASALADRLGPGALDSPSVATTAARRVVHWKVGAALTVTLCVLGRLAFVWLQPAAKPESRPAHHATNVSLPPAELHPTTVDPSPAESMTTHPHEALARPSKDQLSREVVLLSRATRALHAGDTVAALKALDEHQRKFPNGVLRQERRAAKAQALCSLGRFSEGRAELERLTPDSPEAAGARALCKPQP